MMSQARTGMISTLFRHDNRPKRIDEPTGLFRHDISPVRTVPYRTVPYRSNFFCVKAISFALALMKENGVFRYDTVLVEGDICCSSVAQQCQSTLPQITMRQNCVTMCFASLSIFIALSYAQRNRCQAVFAQQTTLFGIGFKRYFRWIHA